MTNRHVLAKTVSATITAAEAAATPSHRHHRSDYFVTTVSMIFAAIVVAVVSGLGRADEGGRRRPNLLVIMMDDLGTDWIGCYGADGIATPHIDAIANDGLRFTRAWSMPQCTPTRVTLLTGQYPHHTGWVNHWDVPRWGIGYFDWHHYTTFANVLNESGYRTAIAGKWQINDFRVEPSALRHHGFESWSVWTGYETGNPISANRYWDPYIHHNDGSRAHPDEFGPDVYCDFLIDFMTQHRDEPMLVYFPMALTHGPLVSTPLRPNPMTALDKHKGMVEYVDHLVGRIVDAVRRLELLDDTILLFFGDNGTSRGLVGTIAGQRPPGGEGITR